jgi:hypothetical protein
LALSITWEAFFRFRFCVSTYIPGPQISKPQYNIYQFLALDRPKYSLYGFRTAPIEHLSTISTSTANVMRWTPRLSSLFLLNNAQSSATPEPLSVPGSLRDIHDAACAWLLGPKAENADHLKTYVEIILNHPVAVQAELFSRR